MLRKQVMIDVISLRAHWGAVKCCLRVLVAILQKNILQIFEGHISPTQMPREILARS
ncbi:hypothetical protein L916_21605 [Phytophthora nicotianae]|uniref:Uncharacterized protein n=1 Tax=Phytophthora nicotianae TaxID=4792 RepID=W2HRA4_PHYNI|nr:hypothetical protein L916_21605 [Phytophthora nicotianae]